MELREIHNSWTWIDNSDENREIPTWMIKKAPEQGLNFSFQDKESLPNKNFQNSELEGTTQEGLEYYFVDLQ